MPSPAQCAQACLAAYSRSSWVADDLAFLEVPTPDGPLIAVRGTEPADLGNWLTDFDAIPWPCFGLGMLHRGFLDAALALLPGVLAGVDTHQQVPFLTGHSLGGAIAQAIAGLLVARHGLVPPGVMGFGSPRVGGDKFRVVLRGAVPVTLYRHGDDPVPLVPSYFPPVSPPIEFGKPSLDPIEDHLITGYLAGLTAMEMPDA